jgi:proteasome lid subunit RPN8/RPN11
MAPLRGRFCISEPALLEAERLLPTYRGPDGDHEGVLFLLGRELEQVVLFTAVLAPEADHGPQRVICSPDQVAAASRAARAAGLGLLGQVHSHPGEVTWHTRGDNELALMPYEGMLSIVVPHHARFGLRPLDSLGVHQFQDGRWILAKAESVRSQISIVPASLDLRP